MTASTEKAKTMKIVSAALLAGLGMVASALPAAASPAPSATIGGSDGYSGHALLIQYSAPSRLSGTGEYNGRSEERGGNFKRKAKKAKK
jgi:hypothetical protein